MTDTFHDCRKSRILMVVMLLWLSPVWTLLAQPPLPDGIFANGFEAPNQAPVAHPGVNQAALVGVPVMLDGSASFDPDGDPLDFNWSVIQRPVESGAEAFDGDQVEATLIPDRPGTYVLQLIVSDGLLFSDPATVKVIATGELSDSMVIGPSGGAVGLSGGASILVPPGALDSSTLISITQISLPPGAVLPPTGVLVSEVYDLAPNGQTFQRPVQIVIPYDPDLLPAAYEEGAIAIYRSQGSAEFNMVGSENGEDQPSSNGQSQDSTNLLLSVLSSTFSAYAAVGARRSLDFTSVALTGPNSSVTVRRPPQMRTDMAQHHNCVPNSGQTPLPARNANQIDGIVIHSTNNGKPDFSFENELGWASNTCSRWFAHYYIDRNGDIFQIVDDLRQTLHTATSLGLGNANTIGIELFLNVGEPYDGRQVAALIRLVDYLMDLYDLPRPKRSPMTGLDSRNRVHINLGGDRIVGHKEIAAKCDPSGTFMDAGIIKPEHVGVRCDDPGDPRATPKILSVGDSRAPALMDLVLDATAVLARDGQHTGVINTKGGDAFELGRAGHGGDVQFIEDAVAVEAHVGDQERKHWQENDPNLTGQPDTIPIGPGPLIVGPGTTTVLTSRTGIGRDDIREYTDVIVAGTLIIQGSLGFALTGSFYVSPSGRILLRDGRHGANLGVYSRGVPVIQGLIDARGENGIDSSPDGGNGGIVLFTFAHPGLLLVPTLYTRGGDADFADVLEFDGGPRGGDGGDITIAVNSTHMFLGGGIGPYLVATQTQLPPMWLSGTVEAGLYNPNIGTRWVGDYLPPTPPVRRYSAGTTWPPPLAYRAPKRTIAAQPGFKRGILSSGGMGGFGVGTADGNQHGGPAGDGGIIDIQLGGGGVLTFRDVDIATGGEIESMSHRLVMPPPAPDGVIHLTCTSAGAHGGFGQDVSGIPAGNGGPGGAAGAVTVGGGAIDPQPSTFDGLMAIQGFPPTQIEGAPVCQRGTGVVGNVVQASDGEGRALYRLRLDVTGQQLLGGHGGIPSGRRVGNPGSFGPRGAEAPLLGLSTQ